MRPIQCPKPDRPNVIQLPRATIRDYSSGTRPPRATAPPDRHKDTPMADRIPLADAQCTPRRGHEHRLGEARLRELLPQLADWSLIDNGHAISKTFRFPDYYRTIAFVNALAYIANAQDHHPDLSVHYDRCVVQFSTHDVGGLSENDFICAAKADALIR